MMWLPFLIWSYAALLYSGPGHGCLHVPIFTWLASTDLDLHIMSVQWDWYCDLQSWVPLVQYDACPTVDQADAGLTLSGLATFFCGEWS